MKSKFFKDTQGLETMVCTPDKVSVCLRLSRRAYDSALSASASLGLTTGEYIETLLLAAESQPPKRVM